MTERLYYTDSYVSEFEAQVEGYADEGRRLYLDRSAFYPTSGGQPFDLGSLQPAGGDAASPLRVVDVIDEGERVAHVLTGEAPPALPVGCRVVGRIDWARRFDHMQQHSGQHLLSALFQELFGLATLGVHFGAESSTLDLDCGGLTLAQIREIEQVANAAVFEDRAVSVELQEASAAEGLRKVSARSGPLRIVSIADLDRSACGGTHVRRTGEIGPILLRRQERVRKSTRIELLCGGRATLRARADYEALARLGSLLSTSVDGVAEVITSRLAELKAQTAALRDAREALDGYRAAELYARACPNAAGLRVSLEQRPAGTLHELRGLAQAYIALPRAVFLATLDESSSILFATSQDSGLDAGALLKATLLPGGGRGGGSARLAQGTVENGAAALANTVEELLLRVGS